MIRGNQNGPLLFFYGFHDTNHVTFPIFYSVAQRLNFEPIWFKLIIVLLAEIDVITPSDAVNVLVIKGIAPQVPLETIFKEIFAFLFLAALIMVTVQSVLFSQFTTFLPK
jgi:TRAP-type C4-dicarboxylate transport system permease large subunit